MSAIELKAGQILGRYELLMPIAKGGMAQVWAARLRGTRGFQKLVAMKTILAGEIEDSALEQMFLEEASLASQIHHPNVVETLELGEQDGTLYLAMEWAEGETLNAILRHASERSLIPLPIAINLVGQACKGLHAAHELADENGTSLGLVHRDISPHNILVTYSGTVKIVDFGIAKAMNKNTGLTEAGQVKGKCAYMAPEQMRLQTVDRRADVFGMGIVLYQLTTGRHPFRGDSPAQTIHNIVSTKPTILPSQLVRDYPPKLELVVMKAIKKDPNRRWATAHEMLEALEDVMAGCLEASFETTVQQFLRGLFGERAATRRAALKSAQEQLDKVLFAPGSGPGTPAKSWMPEHVGAATGSSSSVQMPHSSTQLGAEVPMQPKLLFSLAGVATVLAIIAVIVAVAQPFGSREPAANSEPRAATRAPLPSAEPPIPAPPATENPPPESDAKPESGAKPESEPGKKSSTRRLAARPVVVAPSAPPPSPQPKSEPEPPPAAPKPSAKSAWDAKAFGGRQ